MKLKVLVVVVLILGITFLVQAEDRLYSFQLRADGYQYVCQLSPDSKIDNIETGVAIFWKIGTPNNWMFRYEDNNVTIHMSGLPGFFIHLGSNGLIYSPPGTFTMYLQ